MEYLNKNMQAMANNFNWDDIEVGNHALNHSQKFFAKKHIKHERLDESEEEMDVLKEIDAITLDDTFTSNLDKENVNNTNTSTFDTKSPLKETKHAILNEGDGTDVKFLKTCPQLNTPGKICREQEEIKSTSQSESPINSLKEIKSQPANTLVLSESLIARNKARINPSANKKAPSESNIKDSEPTLTTKTVKLSESLIVRNKARINPGVKTEKVANPTTAANGSTVSTGTIAKPVTAPAPTAPHAYQCNELYKRRKEEQLQKCIEEERKRREFHSRPVPNFNAVHKSLQQRKVLHVVTVPVTPMVLKKSNETEAKRKKKLEDKKQIQPPKFEPRHPTILHEEPFIPKKTQTVLVPCPFNLHSERRLQERKQYDATVQRVMEQKQKQVEIEEEERKRREEQRIKELRKLTTFKARPNPFK
ncbi:targeting protein for Xklp2 isoform X1 [Bactrocera oleae]|uniref:targeting protein for Xklp2 isoform X1 n=1 Tax=Bactrocera oleae TaxID=104688 RepID=UPI0006B7C144|nr:inner centromere protein A isoform X5 [Bactrocera oleae]